MGYDSNRPNTAEYGTPQTSAFGEALKSALSNLYATFVIVPQKTYLNRGFYGRVQFAPGKVVTVYAPRGFRGQLPLNEQPLVNKPYPYKG